MVSEYVKTSFLQTGEAKIELLEATHPDSAIAKYLEKKPEGLHHIAFEVDDIYAEMERLRKEGFQLLNAEPKRGADNKLGVLCPSQVGQRRTPGTLPNYRLKPLGKSPLFLERLALGISLPPDRRELTVSTAGQPDFGCN